MAQTEAQLKQGGLSVEQKKVLDQIKAKMGETVIKLRAQRQMQRDGHAMQVIKPPVEPSGRAKNGKAFVQ